MVKKEHISSSKKTEVVMTLHRHWIILVYHFLLYFLTFIITTWVLVTYKFAIIEIIRYEAIYWAGDYDLLDCLSDIYPPRLDQWRTRPLYHYGFSSHRYRAAFSSFTRVTECSLDRVQEVNANTSWVLQTIFSWRCPYPYRQVKPRIWSWTMRPIR